MTRLPLTARRRSATATRLRTLSVSALAVAGAVVLLAGCSAESAGQPTVLAPAPATTAAAVPTSTVPTVSVASPSSVVATTSPPVTSSNGVPSPDTPVSPASSTASPAAPVTPTVTLPPQSTVTVVVTDPPTTIPPVVTSTAPQPTLTVTRTGGDAGGGHDYAQWSSPSGNIGCAIADNAVRCDIGEITFTAPKPADCSMGVPRAIVMAKGDTPAFACISDTVMTPDAPVLQYGESTTLDGFTCKSQEDGMYCTDDSTGATFRLARGSYDLG